MDEKAQLPILPLLDGLRRRRRRLIGQGRLGQEKDSQHRQADQESFPAFMVQYGFPP
jgi:hypothetical protein